MGYKAPLTHLEVAHFEIRAHIDKALKKGYYEARPQIVFTLHGIYL